MKNLKNKHIHFVGIGGISMSALANFSLEQGAIVTGTEKVPSILTKNLENLGVKITKHHNKIGTQNCDLLVFSGAVKENHPDIILAKKLNKKILERPKFLNLLSKQFKTTIAVSGTHGKTTTTAMIAKVLEPQNPTVHIGGVTQDFGNFKVGDKNIFITEACEYKKSFLSLNPHISVILNIEEDHMDFYKTKTSLIKSFQKFFEKTSNFTVINHDFLGFFNQNFANAKIISFGFSKDCNFWAKNLSLKNDKFCFDVFHKSKKLGKINLGVFGKHNIQNALAAIAVNFCCGQDFLTAKKALENFQLPKRRFEFLNDFVIRDYAHHPTEIKAALKTAKQIIKGKIFCVFEPHTFSRTLFLFDEFLTCFDESDFLIFLPTYSAREKEIQGGTSFDLFTKTNHPHKHYFKEKQDCFKFLDKNIKKGDLVLFVGAGSIGDFAEEFAKNPKI